MENLSASSGISSLSQWGAGTIVAVAFDLDGTLIDSAADIAAATNYALMRAELPLRQLAEVRSFIGDGSRKLLERASGLQQKDPVFEFIVEEFLAYYLRNPVEHTVLLPGALEVLQALAGKYRLALCTNKPRQLTLPVLEGLQLASFFEAVVAAGDVPQTKPHAAPLQEVARLLGVRCEQVVMVGDGTQDIGCARAAGCRSIALDNGLYASQEALLRAKPDVSLPLNEVSNFLLS